MIDEKKWHNEKLAKITIEKLRENNFTANYFSDRNKAVEHIKTLIPSGAEVGVGGSATLQELGIINIVKDKNAVLLFHGFQNLTLEEKNNIRRKQLVSDVFFTSANAITLNGEIVNVDGAGNRVAAMTYGPKKVVVVAGINKIVSDVRSGFERIRLYAAPKNNFRLGLNNPCVKTGICQDCSSKERICNTYSVIRKKALYSNIEIVLIGEALGF